MSDNAYSWGLPREIPLSPPYAILLGGNTGGKSKDFMESGQKILLIPFLSQLFGPPGLY